MGLFENINEIAGKTTIRKNPSSENANSNFFNPDAGKKIEPEEIKNNTESGSTASVQTSPTPTPSPQRTPLSPDKAKQSGDSSAYMITSTTEMIRSGIAMYKHVNSLTENEKIILEKANNKNKSDLTEEDFRVMQKYVRASQKYEKKKEKIPTEDKDFEMLSKGMAKYHEITGKESSPELIAISVIMKYVVNITMDSYLD